jgi:hypothetical protein
MLLLSKPMVAGSAALALIAAGGGYALAASSRNTITVCVRHRGGTLYEARRCAAHDAKLTWNKQGPPGPFPATLPSGRTLTGDYRTDFTSSADVTDTQSFTFPLASKPAVHFVGIDATAPAQCPGTATDPKAARGNLCVYAALGSVSATAVLIINPETNFEPDASPRGFTVAMAFSGSFSTGSWAVTGP